MKFNCGRWDNGRVRLNCPANTKYAYEMVKTAGSPQIRYYKNHDLCVSVPHVKWDFRDSNKLFENLIMEICRR